MHSGAADARTRERELLLRAALDGLSGEPRRLPCRFFYDAEGSRLFEAICELPEYYLTRTEDALLAAYAAEMVAGCGPAVDVIELGSGNARKTRRLLRALCAGERAVRFLPVDVSEEQLAETARALAGELSRLEVHPLALEYDEALRRLRGPGDRQRLALFLGSNLGNFGPDEAVAFLQGVRGMLGPGDPFLLGVDLQKEPAVLQAAYDDTAGVTARFNRNLLVRLQRELDAEIDPDAFDHRAVYNEAEGRIEMYLVSRWDQVVRLAGQSFRFRTGEPIHTENSYKFTLPQLRTLAQRAGFLLDRTWQDERQFFSVNRLLPR